MSGPGPLTSHINGAGRDVRADSYTPVMSDDRPWLRRPSWRRTVDGALVGGLLVVDFVAQSVATSGRDVTAPPLSLLAVSLAVVGAAAFWWWRRRPLAVFVAVVVMAIVAAGAVPPGLLTQQSGVSLALASLAVGSWSDRRRWAMALPAVVLVLLVVGGVEDGAGVLQSGAAALAVVAFPVALGSAARSRRLYVEEVERRLIEAERERDERARRAVLDERTHIARELHDVVAHHVSLIGVQAGAARTALDRSPEATGAALAAIEATSRSAVGEMRHLLDVLRADGDPAAIQPAPGLDDLDRLVAGFTGSGIDVIATVRRRGPALTPSLDLCCFRLVEEALTNVARHSAASRATLEIDVDRHRVLIGVDDPGPPRPTGNGTGRGLAGMAERVALFDGSLRVGPVANGGFAVSAELPRDDPS